MIKCETVGLFGTEMG